MNEDNILATAGQAAQTTQLDRAAEMLDRTLAVQRNTLSAIDEIEAVLFGDQPREIAKNSGVEQGQGKAGMVDSFSQYVNSGADVIQHRLHELLSKL